MNSYTHALTNEQTTKLRALLQELGFDFSPKQYTLFFAQKNKLSVAVYEKGPKVLVQGRDVEEFVQFELEPKILGEAKLGYEEVHSPEMLRCSTTPKSTSVAVRRRRWRPSRLLTRR